MPTVYAVATRGERLHHQVEAAAHTADAGAPSVEQGTPADPAPQAQPADLKGRPGM